MCSRSRKSKRSKAHRMPHTAIIHIIMCTNPITNGIQTHAHTGMKYVTTIITLYMLHCIALHCCKCAISKRCGTRVQELTQNLMIRSKKKKNIEKNAKIFLDSISKIQHFYQLFVRFAYFRNGTKTENLSIYSKNSAFFTLQMVRLQQQQE